MDRYKKPFQIFLEKSLRVTIKDHMTIIYDESMESLFNDLVQAIIKVGVSATFVNLPKKYQDDIINKHIRGKNKINNVSLPKGLTFSISESSVIINFLNSNPKTTKIRTSILDEQRTKGSRYAHCPGFSEDVLKILMDTKFEEVYANSELTAWALGQGESLRLVTQDRSGIDHTLSLDLDGWANEPLMDSGIIFEDSWGNTPPGETFCCPRHKTVNGSVCINGSLPGIKLLKGEECILVFEQGKLIEWKTNNKSCNDFFNYLQKEAKKRRDLHWNSFAELGIGLNSAIKKLSGVQLFDEKMAGTIHIAIGMNAPFGHNLKSNIHIDMVIMKPKLYIDDKLIIEKGKILFEVINGWRKNFQPSEIKIGIDDFMFFDKSKFNTTENHIQRRLSSGGRVGYVNIVGKINDRFCMKLENSSKENEVKFYIRDLLNLGVTNEEKERITYLLKLLIHYKIFSKIKSNDINEK